MITLNFTAINVYLLEQKVSELQTVVIRTNNSAAANSRLA